MSFGSIDLGQGVDQGLYEEEFERKPALVWHGKMNNEGDWGYWSVDRESFSGVPADFQEHEMRRGSNPNSPMEPVYISYRLTLGSGGRLQAADHIPLVYSQKRAGRGQAHVTATVVSPDA